MPPNSLTPYWGGENIEKDEIISKKNKRKLINLIEFSINYLFLDDFIH